MNDEISEEAKKSLANLAKRKAFDRLDRDGAHSTPPCSVASGRSLTNEISRRPIFTS
jgi:hypothetical protein